MNLQITATDILSSSEEDTVKSLISENLNISKSNIHNFQVESILLRRSLLTYTLTYSFDIIITLSDTDASSAAELSTEFADKLDEDSDFAEAVTDALPDIVISGTTVNFETDSPTVQPSEFFLPSLDEDDEDDVGTASVLVIALVLLSSALIVIVGYTLYKNNSSGKELNGTKDDDDLYGIEIGQNQQRALEVFESNTADFGNGTEKAEEIPAPLPLNDDEISSPLNDDTDQDKFELAVASSTQEL